MTLGILWRIMQIEEDVNSLRASLFHFLQIFSSKRRWLQYFLCVFLCFFRSVLVRNSASSSSSRKIILLRSLWMKSLQQNILYCSIAILPHRRFRASTLLPSWKMNACGSTENVCVGRRDVLGLRHSFLRGEWTRAKALRTSAWEAETLQLYDTKETSMKTSVWKINTHFPTWVLRK